MTTKITKQAILEKLGSGAEELIYQEYFGLSNVYPGTYHRNPKSSSNKKTLKFYVSSQGKLMFMDFSPEQSDFRGDCVDAVMKIRNYSYSDALLDIDSVFRLGLALYQEYTPIVRQVTEYVPYVPSEADIEVIRQELTFYDKAYLESYYIDLAQLPKFGVSSCKACFLNGALYQVSTKHRPLFVYSVDDKVKVYSPLNRSKKKWLGNVTKDKVAGYASLPEFGDELVIASSVKDSLIFATHGYYSISYQSEGIVPEDLSDLERRFKVIYVWLDCDLAGVEAVNKWLTLHPNIVPIFWHSPEKDISDYSKAYGYSKTNQLLKSNLTWLKKNWKEGHTFLLERLKSMWLHF